MDKTPKKLNINEINANKIFEIKKNLIFSDIKMQNITHKKILIQPKCSIIKRKIY